MNKKIESFAKKYIPARYLTIMLNTRDYFRSLFYWGNNFVCPVCNGHFCKLLPFGINPRPNAQCPRCSSLERHRLIWLYLREKTNFFTARLKVLHFAPERCFQGRFKSMPNLDYITADLDSPFADRKIDIIAIPFEDETFDCVFCSHVLEHVPDDRKAMREIYRILKRGGWAILQVPIDNRREKTFEDPAVTDPKEREKLFGQWDHVRIYGKDYKNRLEKAGFKVEIYSYAKEDRDKYGLIYNEEVYCCFK